MNSMPQLANPTASPGLPALASPQMLQQRIEEKGNQPNGLPNDLIDALALQQVLENQEHAKAQMALQQAQQMGQPVPVVEQLKQKAVANARDEVGQKIAALQMMQARAQQAQAQPQGINMAQANLGRGYAGGGIIAFSGEEQSDVPKANDPNPNKWTPAKYIAEFGIPAAIAKYGYKTVEEAAKLTGIPKSEILRNTAKAGLTPLRGAVGSAMLSEAAGPVLAGGAAATELAGGIMAAHPELQDAYRGNYMLSAMDPSGGLAAEIMGASRERPPKQSAASAPKAEYKYGDNTPQPLRDRQSQYPRSTYVAPGSATAPAVDPDADGSKTAAATYKALSAGIAMPKAEKYVDPDEEAMRKFNREAMGVDMGKVWEDAAKRHRDYVGIDALLKGQEDDIAERKKLQAGIAAKRDPLRKFLYEFSAADPRKGLGGWMGAAGEQTTKQMDEWDTDDLKFNAEIMKLKAEVTKAKIEGREKDAKAAEDAIKEALATKRAAVQSQTSLIDTRVRSADALQGRIQAAQLALQRAKEAALERGDRKAAANADKHAQMLVNASRVADEAFRNDPVVKGMQDQLALKAMQAGKSPEAAAEYQRMSVELERLRSAHAARIFQQIGVPLPGSSTAPAASSSKAPPRPAGAVTEVK